MNETTNEQVTISAAYFAELWRKANETDKICRECTNEHTAEEFAAIKRERDELKAKLEAEQLTNANIGIVYAMKWRDNLAAAERCIEDCFNLCNKEWNATANVINVINTYREKKEVGAK